MPKKSASTSNVPNSHNNKSSTGAKVKSPQKNNGASNSGNSNVGIINSKHLHNQSHQQKVKNKRENSEQTGGNENLLMKKLFEAVQKQKANENQNQGEKRTRKGTAPLPKTMNSSQTYAGAAFDRAPAAASFPIPSFIKTGASESGACGPALSSSCPLPGLEAMGKSGNLKAVSVTDLFKATAAKDSENESSEASEIEENSIKPEEKKKLQSLTNDLRRMLNLR